MAHAPKSEAYAIFYIVSYFAGVTGDEWGHVSVPGLS